MAQELSSTEPHAREAASILSCCESGKDSHRTVSFTAGPIGFDCHVPAEHASAIEHQIGQYFDPAHQERGQPGSASLHLIVSDHLLRQARRCVAGRGTQVQTFCGEWYERLAVDDAVWFSPVRGVEPDHVLIRTRVGGVVIVNASVGRASQLLVRSMREFLLRALESSGGVAFHAAAIGWADAGLMLCGDKGAGKTTLMTRLIESFGADFVANDRTFITPNLVGHPLPLSVRLGRGTILSSRSLQRFVRRRSLHRPNPRLDELPAGFAARQKIELTPREFATAVGTSTSAGFLLRAVVVADLDLACQGATLLRLATDETLAELERVCFTPDHHQWLEPIFGDRPPGAGGATERFLVRLTETVPAYRLRYGPAFPSDEDRDMLASLLGLVQT